MWWARSRLLNIDIDAAQANQWPGSFVCPICTRPVVLRSGPVIPPYFAHRRGEGTGGCENYHPPSRLRQAIGLRLAGARSSSEEVQLPFLAIRGDAPREVELVIRIPKTGAPSTWSGVVLLDTGLGEMPINSVGAERGVWASVSPLRQYAVTVSGEVDPFYASGFYDAPLGLEPSGSLFRYGEGVQRQLPKNEPIYWGTSYWLVGQAAALQLSRAPAALDVDIADLKSPWLVALVTLPPADNVAGDQMLLAERWLRRSVVVGRESLSFVDPLPHHFDHDGTPVFESDAYSLRLRCPGDMSLVIYNDAGEQAAISVNALADEHNVRLNASGKWHILLGGRPAGSIRLEDCAALIPPRVLLKVGEMTALLPTLEAEALLKQSAEAHSTVQVAVDIENLRDLVTVNGTAWPSSESLVWTIEGRRRVDLTVAVRGIGAVGGTICSDVPVGTVTPKIAAVASWLWSVSDAPYTLSSPIGINLPPIQLPAVFRRLEGRRWHVKYAAHVRLLQSTLFAGDGHDL